MAKKKTQTEDPASEPRTVPVDVLKNFRDRNTGTLHLAGERNVRYGRTRIAEVNATKGGPYLKETGTEADADG